MKPKEKKLADLHIHTYYSDGSYSPSEVINFAKKAGLKTIALTDHDTIKGILPGINSAQSEEIELIPAIELSAGMENFDIHILGYFIDWENKNLNQTLDHIEQRRKKRLQIIVDKLYRIGVKVDMNDLFNFIGKGTISRLHIANYLSQKGLVENVSMAFKKYLGEGKPAYENIGILNPQEAIQLILGANGIPVLAHPGLIKKHDLISFLISIGLRGLEVFHPSHSLQDISFLTKIANEYNLLITGGSDCHGTNKDENQIGKIKLDYKYVEELKKYS